MGVHGPFGWSIYLKGDSGSYYFITHLGSREQSAGMGANVRGGQQIGTVGNYAKWGGANHTHVGVNPQGKSGHPDINDLMNAMKLKGQGTNL
jgi:murein DD-endopeptidase MepM/ murein hydrolase activator NlpD